MNTRLRIMAGCVIVMAIVAVLSVIFAIAILSRPHTGLETLDALLLLVMMPLITLGLYAAWRGMRRRAG